jgi:2-polyprenyl-3-methyl-5-hydroxy-6-metoxy-1,4-benzoquinol methylase
VDSSAKNTYVWIVLNRELPFGDGSRKEMMENRKGHTRADWLNGASATLAENDFGPTRWHDHKIAFMVKYARGKRVLDIGCVDHNPANYQSQYWLHKALKEVAKELVGVDLLGEGVRYLIEKGYNVIHADAESLSLGERFDVVIAGDVLEHLSNPGLFLDATARHLAPGGQLLISTPNPWHWRFIVKGIVGHNLDPNPEHTCWFCPQTLSQLCGRYGLRLRELAYGSRYWKDRAMPLPPFIKHTSFHAAFYEHEQGI